MTDLVASFLLSAVPAVLAITLHEVAHGWAALALGDDTARRLGRLSVNPLRHVDPVGTVLLPGVLVASQLLTTGRVLFLFGWAKPVPVSAWRFRDPRRGMMLVAAAGPALNLLLSWLAALALHGVALLPFPARDGAGTLLELFMLYNLVLGLFNLLPVPPLDGGRIVVGLLPERLAARWAGLERAGLVLVLLLVYVLPYGLREAGIAFDPVGRALNDLVPRAFDLLLRLAGHGG